MRVGLSRGQRCAHPGCPHKVWSAHHCSFIVQGPLSSVTGKSQNPFLEKSPRGWLRLRLFFFSRRSLGIYNFLGAQCFNSLTAKVKDRVSSGYLHPCQKDRQREVPPTRKPAASLRAVMRTPHPESACGRKAGRDLLYLSDWSPGQPGGLRASWSPLWPPLQPSPPPTAQAPPFPTSPRCPGSL